MKARFRYGKEDVFLEVPDDSVVYTSEYGIETSGGAELLLRSVESPVGCTSLKEKLKERREGRVVVVVSDITRPIPYRSFLPALLDLITGEGVDRKDIIILVATGMHRASTPEEKIYMFGASVAENYKIVDHDAENEDMLLGIDEKSWSGAKVELNRHYVEAGFRILTGLVEPHFMAGFSGGRKSICPGLASLQTIQKFHGYEFLNDPNAEIAVLKDNPCHLENSSIARICPADFSVNVVLDREKRLNKIISGDQFLSHEATVAYLKERCCRPVESPADLAITSCGGYPLDATFYQCVKGLVNCLPALKEHGEIIAFGACSEGIGSPEYESLMKRYSHRTDEFLEDIKEHRFFIKDQWQFQMHIRALKKTGAAGLHFFTDAIPHDELNLLSVTAHSLPLEEAVRSIQHRIDTAAETGKKIAVFPEGPYCSPVSIRKS